MLTFHYTWSFILLIIAPLAWFILPAYRESRRAIRVPWFDRLAQLFGITTEEGAVVRGIGLPSLVIRVLLWLLVNTALARPQYIEDPIVRVVPTRDLLLMVDLSGSMETVDFVNK